MARPPLHSVGNYTDDPELVELLAAPPKQLCPVGMMLKDHPNSAEIRAAIDNPKWSAAQLSPVLSRKVSRVSSDAINKHRSELCNCYRED